ncbi:dienelactone hydrolase family protein [Salinarimonas rosea]|uniref:dienelactone hydrolase family protein n=1 Tax=Salinarimonas rosea TaxID=552063 RepID=UPI000411F569|nr:alpha/beta fold hydrolase [Salinarimonas rosea]
MAEISFQTRSPFTLADMVRGDAPETTAKGFLYTPGAVAAAKSRPAVVILPGLGGIIAERELRYAKRLAAEGYVTLAVDTFGSRDAAYSNHTRRALHVTETMMLADAYAALAHLASLPMVDPARVAVMGFSYGGMIAVLAAYRQMAELFDADGLRFAGHVSYYGCSVPRFDDPTTTGAPVEIFLGALDRNVDPERSREIAEDLRRGGSRVGFHLFEDTYHQWDSQNIEKKFVRFSLYSCRFAVDRDNRLRDLRTRLPITGRVSRTLALTANADPRGYHMLRDEAVMARTDARLSEFLAEALANRPPRAAAADAGARTAPARR